MKPMPSIWLLVSSVSSVSLSACLGATSPGPAAQPTTYQDAVADCMRYGGATPQICEASARQRFGDQTPAATSGQWADLEATARKLGGAAPDSKVLHLEAKDTAQQQVPVVAGRCTTIAFAWTGSHPTYVAVMFGGTNLSLAGTSATLAQPGSLEVCPDKTGDVTLAVHQLEAVGGAIRTGARLEYAVATSDRVESEAQAAHRRGEDAERAKAAKAQIASNLYNSDLSRGGEAFAESCQRCREVATTCLDDHGGADSCELKFTTCAQGLGTDDRGGVLCAAP